MPPVLNSMLMALVWAVMGVLIFAASFAIVDKLTPYDLWKELCESRNLALGVVVGATALGISIIVAAAIH